MEDEPHPTGQENAPLQTQTTQRARAQQIGHPSPPRERTTVRQRHVRVSPMEQLPPYDDVRLPTYEELFGFPDTYVAEPGGVPGERAVGGHEQRIEAAEGAEEDVSVGGPVQLDTFGDADGSSFWSWPGTIF